MVIRRTSFPTIPPFSPLSTNEELLLCVCSDTVYVVCVLHYMYLIMSIVTVSLLVDANFLSWLVGLLLLVVNNTLRVSTGEIVLSWSDVVFARRLVQLSLDVSVGFPVGYVSSILVINSNVDMT